MRERSWLRLLLWGGAYLFVGLILLAAVGASVLKTPFLITPIRSNSMYPLLKRGDAAIIAPLASEKKKVAIGDIIVFRAEGGSLAAQGWVIHRVVDGDPEQGYVTQGDANPDTDQNSGGATLVKPEKVAAKAITLDGQPLKIRLFGYPSLWLEGVPRSPYMVPTVLGAAGIILLISELTAKKKRRKRLPLSLAYLVCGFTISVVLAATQLSGSTFLTYKYEVSDQGQGALMGSTIGIVQLGETVTRTVSEVTGKGFLPMIISVTTSDPDISFDKELFIAKNGTSDRVALTMVARQIGEYESHVTVGLFLPTLPPAVIHGLAKANYWLALSLTSLIPALPLLGLAILDPHGRRAFRRLITPAWFR